MLSRKPRCGTWILALSALCAPGAFAFTSFAQERAVTENAAAVHDQHESQAPATSSSLSQQLHVLQKKVAVLEAALKQNHEGMQDSGGMQLKPKGGGKMGMGKGMGMMSGMGGMSGTGMADMGSMKSMPMMGGMSGANGMGMSGMGMMRSKGMSMMGQMKDMGQMQMPSALPGFAGASHIYHIGATSFFLDHPQHIALTQDQQSKLNQIKEKVLLGQATFDRWTSQGEQELWVLTGSDSPNATEIEAKIREIQKLGGDKRIAYIRAVGEAAQVLTADQRQTLIGMLPSDHAAASQH